MPAEATETVAPIVIWRKELAPDTGGTGLLRGGVGQVIEIGGTDGAPFSVLAQFERIDNPARGRGGGLDGAAGTIALNDCTKLRGKGQQTIPPGRRLRLVLPGGAGYGDPRHRTAEDVATDVRNDLVSPETARRDYAVAVAVAADGALDEPATAALRVSGGSLRSD